MRKVLIVDDHVMFAEGLAAYLADCHDIEVVGQCYDGQDVLEFLEHTLPDLILLDVSLPNINGLDLCKTIKSKYPQIKILILSMHNEQSIISLAIRQGANGYILKNIDGSEMKQAIRTVSQGRSFYCSSVTEIIVKGLTNQKPVGAYRIIPRLSRREKQILRLIVDELTTHEIADRLCLSTKTIEAARSQLLSKVSARNTAGLVKAAYELKLLD